MIEATLGLEELHDEVVPVPVKGLDPPEQAERKPPMVGFGFEKIVTSSKVEVQGLFAIVHLNTDDPPIVKPVTPDVGEVGFVTSPVPEITDQLPVPTTGVFPPKVEIVILHKF